VNRNADLLQRARLFGTDPLAEPNRRLVPRVRYRTRRAPRVALRKRLEEEERQSLLAASAQGRLVAFPGYGPARHATTTLPNSHVVPLERPGQRRLTPQAAEAAVDAAARAAAEPGGMRGAELGAGGGGARAASPASGRRSPGHRGLLGQPNLGLHFPGDDEERRVRIALLSTPRPAPSALRPTPALAPRSPGSGDPAAGPSTARTAETSESGATAESGGSGATGATGATSQSGGASGSSSSGSGSESEEDAHGGGRLEVGEAVSAPALFQ